MKAFRNSLRGLVTGLLVSFIITLFADLIALMGDVFSRARWLIVLIPVGTVLIHKVYEKMGSDSKKITDNAIEEIHTIEDLADADDDKKITPLMGLVSASACLFSHLLGASVGKEGAGVQLGFTAGSFLSDSEKRLKGTTERDQWLMCGASAAFSCLFGAPIAGTLFGSRIASPRFNKHDSMLPCLIASYSGFIASNAMGIHVIHIFDYEPLQLTMKNLFLIFLIALSTGILSRIMCRLFENVKKMNDRLFRKYGPLRLFGLGTLLSVMSLCVILLSGDARYNGLGAFLITDAMSGNGYGIIDFVLKLSFILVSLFAGFSGGEVVPLLILGSTAVSPLAGALGLPAAPLAALGAVGMLTAGMKLPYVGFALGLELFGYTEPVLLFMMTVVCFVASGKDGIYPGQRIY